MANSAGYLYAVLHDYFIERLIYERASVVLFNYSFYRYFAFSYSRFAGLKKSDKRNALAG